MENTATIEVNGKRYDAVTGVMLGPSSAPPLRLAGRNIDGFFRSRTSTTARVTPPSVDYNIEQLAQQAPVSPSTAPTLHDVLATHAAPKPKRPSAARGINHTRAHTPQAAKARTITVSQPAVHSQKVGVRRGQPNHVHHHAQQHSRTLRRESVPAPQLSTHKTLQPKHALQHTMPGVIALKTPVAGIDPDRLVRAQNSHQSPLITHHGRQTGLVPTFASLAVQPLPNPAEPPAPVPGSGDAPVAPPPQPNNKPDMFEQAMANANHYVDVRSHAATYKRRARLHIASMAAGSFVLIIAATFVAYQNSPSLQLKVASIRSGVSSSLPDLTGTGLTYTGARATNSRLTFGLEGAGGAFQLTQTNTNFSDAELIETIGSTNASGTPAYQAVMAGNTMVYRFSNTSATWVSNGKWYTLSGNAAISDQQVKTIVQQF